MKNDFPEIAVEFQSESDLSNIKCTVERIPKDVYAIDWQLGSKIIRAWRHKNQSMSAIFKTDNGVIVANLINPSPISSISISQKITNGLKSRYYGNESTEIKQVILTLSRPAK